MKHAYTKRSNANSKAQANMHTSRNSQCASVEFCDNLNKNKQTTKQNDKDGTYSV